jgi:hypothetical protein
LGGLQPRRLRLSLCGGGHGGCRGGGLFAQLLPHLCRYGRHLLRCSEQQLFPPLPLHRLVC